MLGLMTSINFTNRKQIVTYFSTFSIKSVASEVEVNVSASLNFVFTA